MQTIPIWRPGVNVRRYVETAQSFNDLAI
jgi:hypothetical protein